MGPKELSRRPCIIEGKASTVDGNILVARKFRSLNFCVVLFCLYDFSMKIGLGGISIHVYISLKVVGGNFFMTKISQSPVDRYIHVCTAIVRAITLPHKYYNTNS